MKRKVVIVDNDIEVGTEVMPVFYSGSYCGEENRGCCYLSEVDELSEEDELSFCHLFYKIMEGVPSKGTTPRRCEKCLEIIK